MLSAAVFFSLLLSVIAQLQPASIVVRPPAYSTAFPTQSVIFTCVAYGSPTPSGMKWTTASGKNLNAMSLDPSISVNISVQTITAGGATMLVSVLELCNVDMTFTDAYSCAADNGVSGTGIAPSWATFNLTVIQPAAVPPTIVLRPPVDNTVNQGESIQITCVAYGSPIPSIYWSKPGCLRMGNNTNNIYVFSDMITVSNVTMHRSMLQICNADTDDNTQYSCWADNGVTGMGLGDSSADFNVQVFVPTDRPTESPTDPTVQTDRLFIDEGLPYLIVMVVLVMLLIVLLVVVVVMGVYILSNRKQVAKTNYSVSMGAVNPASEGYEISTNDDQQLIHDVEKHDLALEAEDEGTDLQ